MKPVLFLIYLAMLVLYNIDSFGQKVHWINKLDTTSSGECISGTKAGNYLIGGRYDDKSMIALFDSNGNKLWERKICDTCGKYSSIVFSKELEDGRILLISDRTYLFITDSTGENIDTQIYIGAATGYYESLNKILYFNDELIFSSRYKNGSFLSRFSIPQLKITSRQNGSINQMAIAEDSFLIVCYQKANNYIIQKLTSTNQIIWEKNIGIDLFTLRDLIVSKDQRIILLGHVIENNIENCLILALNTKGDSLWKNIYRYSPQRKSEWSFNNFYKIKETNESDLVLVGQIGWSSPFFPTFALDIIKINSLGEFIWEHSESIIPEGTWGKDFLFDQDQNIVIIGATGLTDVFGPERAYIMKLSNPLVSTKNADDDYLSLHPNPCSDELTIENQNQLIKKIEIFTIDGQHVESIENNNTPINVNTSMLTPGIYLCKVFSLEGFSVRKFVKI